MDRNNIRISERKDCSATMSPSSKSDVYVTPVGQNHIHYPVLRGACERIFWSTLYRLQRLHLTVIIGQPLETTSMLCCSSLEYNFK